MKLLHKGFAHGKLLLSGEYLVMHGAVSLAMPVNTGQSIEIFQTGSTFLEWQAFDTTDKWFDAVFSMPDFSVISTSDSETASKLADFLVSSNKLSGWLPDSGQGLLVKTTLGFNRKWGLGSSSSLIALFADFSGADAFELHALTSKGSGYDIACASASSPILYQIKDGSRIITPVDFSPEFSENLYFIYLGKKQDSSKEVSEFLRKPADLFKEEVALISQLSLEMLKSANLGQFISVVEKHESVMEKVLGVDAVKRTLFSDFPGAVKSLGAWGGDFVLAATSRDLAFVKDYFGQKDMHTIVPFSSFELKNVNAALS